MNILFSGDVMSGQIARLCAQNLWGVLFLATHILSYKKEKNRSTNLQLNR